MLVDHLLRTTGANRLVLTGGVALNAVGNMRLLEHFDTTWFARNQQRAARLHLWVPPVPGDPASPSARPGCLRILPVSPRGVPMTHAFYCGLPPARDEIEPALQADDIASERIGAISTDTGRAAVADLDGVHRCAARRDRDSIRARRKRVRARSAIARSSPTLRRRGARKPQRAREIPRAIRPLAPMATAEAAREYFELLDGASDDGFNAYNYMVLTARAKPHAKEKIPAVIHADGTGRIQVVREADDPLIHAYLKALGRRIGVEIVVNTSFNVAGPIAQTPQQAIDTLRRSKGLDAVLMVASDGVVFAAWHGATVTAGDLPGGYRTGKQSKKDRRSPHERQRHAALYEAQPSSLRR